MTLDDTYKEAERRWGERAGVGLPLAEGGRIHGKMVAVGYYLKPKHECSFVFREDEFCIMGIGNTSEEAFADADLRASL